MNMREARLRLSTVGMSISRVGSTTEFRVAFQDKSARENEKSAYYTDDLEDAVLTGLAMRRRSDASA